MKTIEITAKTPEEAIEIALKELDADRAEVEIDVVSRGKTGLLGLGSEPARVRVTLLETPTDVVKIGTGILETLISHMGVDAVASLKSAQGDEFGGPVFDIDGDDSGLLIGRRGETLRALQLLVNLLASRKLDTRTTIMVDVAGYQEKRIKSLTSLAGRVAQRVSATGHPIALEPMPPNERRIVHLALADHPEVVTESTGDREGRQVVVAPKGE